MLFYTAGLLKAVIRYTYHPLIYWHAELEANFIQVETFARKMILLSGKAKTHGKREFMRYK